MIKKDKIKPLREILVNSNLNARKSLGQHFLFDQNLTDRIARAASDKTNDLSE